MIDRVKIVLFSLIFLTGCSGNMPKLGLNNGKLMECPGTPNCVNSQAKDEIHFIQPIQFTGSSSEAKDRLLKVMGEMTSLKRVVVEDYYIRAEFVSAILRFVDDIEFYFPESEENETTIQVRSASRVGRSDFGVNRKRVEEFRSLLK